MSKWHKQQFTKDEKQMRNKYMKMCSFSLIIRRIPVKTIKIAHVWWQRVVIIKMTVSGGGATGFQKLLLGVYWFRLSGVSLTLCVTIRTGILFDAVSDCILRR